ncbi:type VI secretion system-associated FHA domain protein TagH [Shewanella algae]|uniref:type VI secretion system-associated FHA domain protein TagH n=1 Tax=Shewanella algae TaxID=38313 RepID=UPI001186E5A1|nr:type VI secretion system-associated FHA domain protein TagH [Shewanella algae]TVP03002.1 hypothetical protein AYI73_19575 [Shewanella algae]BCV39574.1 type VI secretion protein [Shewanella algae]
MSNLIALNVVNSQLLESGLVPHTRMNKDGGLIGAGPGCEWVLRDRERTIGDYFCRILWLDGHFCIEDLCGRVFLNGSTVELGRDRKARLNENDHIAIGPYKVRVTLLDSEQADDPVTGQLSEWFKSENGSLIQAETAEEEEETDASLDDPLLALDRQQQAAVKSVVFDQESVTKEQENAESLLAKELYWQGKNFTAQADTDFDTGSAIHLNKRAKMDNIMDENALDLLESEVKNGLGNDWPADEGTHIATGPMLRGLGVQLGDMNDTGTQQALAIEMGAALQAAIKGLLSLHQDAQSSRYDLINKNLQPIEDNPLRLGLDYQETVRTLFDDNKSPVHLSPAAAISESLNSIEHHNEAVQHAITEALNYILKSFSPDTLLRRFSQYRKVSESALNPGDNWAWEMYENYYQELTSSRQQGFRKLFWEVFEQAYDKKLRELQREF